MKYEKIFRKLNKWRRRFHSGNIYRIFWTQVGNPKVYKILLNIKKWKKKLPLWYQAVIVP